MIYDAFGNVLEDRDSSDGGGYWYPNSVGYLGKWGAYSDQETCVAGPGTLATRDELAAMLASGTPISPFTGVTGKEKAARKGTPAYVPTRYQLVQSLAHPPRGLQNYTPPKQRNKWSTGNRIGYGLVCFGNAVGGDLWKGRDAQDCYSYFLSAKGGVHHIDVQSLLRDVPSVKHKFDAEYESCVGTILGAKLKPGSYHYQSKKAHPEAGLYIDDDESKNWNATVQTFQAWGDATVTVDKSGLINVLFTWHIHDWYKWHDWDHDPSANVDDYEAFLHDSGLAREYLNIGQAVRQCTFAPVKTKQGATLYLRVTSPESD